MIEALAIGLAVILAAVVLLLGWILWLIWTSRDEHRRYYRDDKLHRHNAEAMKQSARNSIPEDE